MEEFTRLTTRLAKKLSKPVFLQGLPGVGSVGRIVAELLIEQLGAKRIASFPAEEKPGLVLVQQNNRVRFPQLHLYHTRHKRQDFLIMVGDGQPPGEQAYDLAVRLVGVLEELQCKELITIGGIGLQEVASEPKVYVTGTNAELIRRFKKLGADQRVHGVVGPIIGLTGIMLGVSQKRVPAVALLAESIAHPLHIGLRGAGQVLHLLQKSYGFKLDLRALHESIKAIEQPSAPAGELPESQETNYIG